MEIIFLGRGSSGKGKDGGQRNHAGGNDPSAMDLRDHPGNRSEQCDERERANPPNG